jgi:formate--tetrahydrofolate ligase
MKDMRGRKKHNLNEIARRIGLRETELEFYGNDVAKLNFEALHRLKNKRDGKLIICTAITPTKFGEGKTCTAIGVTQALGALNKKVMLCLREPSMGPVFGIKGSAVGSGKSKVIPADKISLHFTGDFSAVSAAHNLLSAVIDNHIYWGNKLNFDISQLSWPRTVDCCDRSLRDITVNLNKKCNLYYRSNFVITAASEVMAIVALAKDYSDLKRRLDKLIV